MTSARLTPPHFAGIQRFNGFPARPPNSPELYAQTYSSKGVRPGGQIHGSHTFCLACLSAIRRRAHPLEDRPDSSRLQLNADTPTMPCLHACVRAAGHECRYISYKPSSRQFSFSALHCSCTTTQLPCLSTLNCAGHAPSSGPLPKVLTTTPTPAGCCSSRPKFSLTAPYPCLQVLGVHSHLHARSMQTWRTNIVQAAGVQRDSY